MFRSRIGATTAPWLERLPEHHHATRAAAHCLQVCQRLSRPSCLPRPLPQAVVSDVVDGAGSCVSRDVVVVVVARQQRSATRPEALFDEVCMRDGALPAFVPLRADAGFATLYYDNVLVVGTSAKHIQAIKNASYVTCGCAVKFQPMRQ